MSHIANGWSHVAAFRTQSAAVAPPVAKMAVEFVIRRQAVVHGGPWRDPVVLKDTKVVNDGVRDVEFFRAKMSDSTVVRLLTGKSRTVNRPQLAILHRMVQLRNDAVYKVLHPPAEIDIGLDNAARPPAKRHKGSIAAANVPEVMTIVMPGTGDLPSRPVRVLRGEGKDVLWLELTADILSYLAAVVSADAEADDDRDETSDTKHIAFDKRRQAFRVRYNGTSKWFPKANSVDAFSDAVQHLTALRTGVGQAIAGDVQPASD